MRAMHLSLNLSKEECIGRGTRSRGISSKRRSSPNSMHLEHPIVTETCAEVLGGTQPPRPSQRSTFSCLPPRRGKHVRQTWMLSVEGTVSRGKTTFTPRPGQPPPISARPPGARNAECQRLFHRPYATALDGTATTTGPAKGVWTDWPDSPVRRSAAYDFYELRNHRG